ncbi:MAG: bifunctional diguanylate cyclase/phosphodiesterase [Trueperaceae bacterium]|nr:bifunctional diguanylate cyclase/phosphodiesterase [Trueperaceae bacterium]
MGPGCRLHSPQGSWSPWRSSPWGRRRLGVVPAGTARLAADCLGESPVRSPHRAPQSRRLRSQGSRRDVRDLRARLDPRAPVRGPRPLQVRQRHLWPRGRRQASAACGQDPGRACPRARPGRAPGRRRVHRRRTRLREEDSARAVARKLVSVLNEPHHIDGRMVHVSASIGVSIYPRDGTTVDALLKNADHAMYLVKEGGKNGVFVTTLESQRVNGRRLDLEKQLRAALQEDEFELYYQPKVDLRTGAPVGVEMLLRWRNRELGLVSPEEFIPMAEETGLIVPLGQWLMRQACHQLRDWDRAGLPPVELAVNVSTLQFRQPDFVAAVEGALDDSGLPPDRLEIEVTESVLMRELARFIHERRCWAGFGWGWAA